MFFVYLLIINLLFIDYMYLFQQLYKQKKCDKYIAILLSYVTIIIFCIFIII